jgi:hypothetical protein
MEKMKIGHAAPEFKILVGGISWKQKISSVRMIRTLLTILQRFHRSAIGRSRPEAYKPPDPV